MWVPEILIRCWQEIEMESPSNLVATSALVSKMAWQRMRGNLGSNNGIKLPQIPVSVVLWFEHQVKSSLLY